MEIFIIVVAIIAMWVGAICFNPLRRKMSGIIGVGGSYLILAGVMLLVMLLSSLFSGAGLGESAFEGIIAIIFLLLCIAYTVYVMLVRCNSVKQRILLPFAAVLIGLGFCLRFLGALIFHIPMGNGGSPAAPKAIYNSSKQRYNLVAETELYADYMLENGSDSIRIIKNDGLPSGWSSDDGF